MSPLGFIMHAPLLIIAIVYGVQHDLWTRDLVSPAHWMVGFIAGHLLFALAVLITHASTRDAWETLKDVRDFCSFVLNAPSVISRYVTIAFGEEVIWRMGGQSIFIALMAPYLGQNAVYAGIGLVALLFTLAHEKVIKRGWLVAIEFLLFSVIIGAVYHFTGSIALCMAIHFIRDLEIVYGEYVEKVHEWGDRERASDFIDRRYDMRGLAQS